MILIEQVFEDGSSIKKQVKTIGDAKKFPNFKKSPLKLIKILEAVTELILAIIPIITKKK